MKKDTIGILGGGQLGRMLTQAAHGLGFRVIILDPTPGSPASLVADEQIVGSFTDAEKIKELANRSDFLTFEIESANSTVLEELRLQGKTIHPSPQTLGIIKDKFGQKQFLKSAQIPVADFIEVKPTIESITEAAHTFDYPIVLKAKHDAYDGRGNALIESQDDISIALDKLKGRELYVEKFVVFEKELAVVAARGADGTIAVYPVMETTQKNHICHTVLASAIITDQEKQNAQDLAIKTLEHLKGVGVFCVEMFLTTDGNVLVNEIAPRVHNSGHLTIEACETSQFENHIRAITGLNLGSTNLKAPAAVMINILGQRQGKANFGALDGTWEEFAKQNDLSVGAATGRPLQGITKIFVHIYGKIETKPERKMGHITVLADDAETALQAAKNARELIEI